jgi:hypothetical protein
MDGGGEAGGLQGVGKLQLEWEMHACVTPVTPPLPLPRDTPVSSTQRQSDTAFSSGTRRLFNSTSLFTIVCKGTTCVQQATCHTPWTESENTAAPLLVTRQPHLSPSLAPLRQPPRMAPLAGRTVFIAAALYTFVVGAVLLVFPVRELHGPSLGGRSCVEFSSPLANLPSTGCHWLHSCPRGCTVHPAT